MRHAITIAALLFSSLVFASTPIPTTIEELAAGADHILIGRVVGVDLIDEKGRELTDDYARTGPGVTNTIRLHVAVDEVLVTNAKKVPKLLKVPLDPFMHYTLGQIKAEHAEPSPPFLLLLRGPSFSPVVPGAVLRSLEERETALRIQAESHPSRTRKAGKKKRN
jgi:hypothetical protein